jgi:hypothetical protein
MQREQALHAMEEARAAEQEARAAEQRQQYARAIAQAHDLWEKERAAIPSMKDVAWQFGDLAFGDSFQIKEVKFDTEKDQVAWRLEAQKDRLDAKLPWTLHARFLDAKNELLKKVDFEPRQGDAPLLKQQEVITVTLKLPDEAVRKQTAKVVITHE